jgi:hypothetical protein
MTETAKALSRDQIELLEKLMTKEIALEDEAAFVRNKRAYVAVARPLRDAALLKTTDGEPLQDGNTFAREIQITPLGRLIAKGNSKIGSRRR